MYGGRKSQFYAVQTVYKRIVSKQHGAAGTVKNSALRFKPFIAVLSRVCLLWLYLYYHAIKTDFKPITAVYSAL